MAPRFSKRLPVGSAAKGPVIEAEWTPLPPETPSSTPPREGSPETLRVRSLRLRRVVSSPRGVDPARLRPAPVMAGGGEPKRCQIGRCSRFAVTSVRAGPLVARVCKLHAATVNATAFLLRHLIGTM